MSTKGEHRREMPQGAAKELFDAKAIDPLDAALIEMDLRDQWIARTVDSAIKIAAHNESVRIRLLKEMTQLGAGKVGRRSPTELNHAMLETDLELARNELKRGRGLMYEPKEKDCAEFLINKTKLYTSVINSETLLRRLRRYRNAKP